MLFIFRPVLGPVGFALLALAAGFVFGTASGYFWRWMVFGIFLAVIFGVIPAVLSGPMSVGQASARGPVRTPRQAIPERVRHEVWRRDQGRCVECGSQERPEFDHIIPLSAGGSNTARNVELRCQYHNRGKAARI
jgi:HNH endonuclease